MGCDGKCEGVRWASNDTVTELGTPSVSPSVPDDCMPSKHSLELMVRDAAREWAKKNSRMTVKCSTDCGCTPEERLVWSGSVRVTAHHEIICWPEDMDGEYVIAEVTVSGFVGMQKFRLEGECFPIEIDVKIAQATAHGHDVALVSTTDEPLPKAAVRTVAAALGPGKIRHRKAGTPRKRKR